MNKKNFFPVISLISIYAIFFFNTSTAQIGKAPAKVDTTNYKDNYVEMNGSIFRFVGGAEVDEKLPTLDGALISVSTLSGPFTTVNGDKKGKCTFKLPLNQSFKILISKHGYISKFFEVNTKVPNGKEGKFTFKFTVDLFEEIKKLDVTVLKKPIAKVTYDIIYDRFQYDAAYTSRINFDIKQMYKSYNDSLAAQHKMDGGKEEKKKNNGPKESGTEKKKTTPKK